MIHASLNSFAQCQTFLESGDNHEHLPAIQYSGHTDGESHPWHCIDIVIEKAGIGEDCVVCEGFNTCAGSERRALWMK